MASFDDGWMDGDSPLGLTKSNTSTVPLHRQSTCLDEDDGSLTPKASKKYAPVFRRALTKIKSKKQTSGKETRVMQLVDDLDVDEEDSLESWVEEQGPLSSRSTYSSTSGAPPAFKADFHGTAQVKDVPPPWPSVQGWCTKDSQQTPSGSDPKQSGKQNVSQLKKKGKEGQNLLDASNPSEEKTPESKSKRKLKPTFRQAVKKMIKQKENTAVKDKAVSEDSSDRRKFEEDVATLVKCYGHALNDPQTEAVAKPKTGKIMNMYSVGWTSLGEDDDSDNGNNSSGAEGNDLESIHSGSVVEETLVASDGASEKVTDKRSQGLVNEAFQSSSLSAGKSQAGSEDTLECLSISSGHGGFPLSRCKSERYLDQDKESLTCRSRSSFNLNGSGSSEESLMRCDSRSYQSLRSEPSGDSSVKSQRSSPKARKGILKKMFGRRKSLKRDGEVAGEDLQKTVGVVTAATKWKRKVGLGRNGSKGKLESESIKSKESSGSESKSNTHEFPVADDTDETRSEKPSVSSRHSSSTSYESTRWCSLPASPPSTHSSPSSSHGSVIGSNVNDFSPKPKRKQSWFLKQSSKGSKKRATKAVSSQKQPGENNNGARKSMFATARVLMAAKKWKKKPPESTETEQELDGRLRENHSDREAALEQCWKELEFSCLGPLEHANELAVDSWGGESVDGNESVAASEPADIARSRCTSGTKLMLSVCTGNTEVEDDTADKGGAPKKPAIIRVSDGNPASDLDDVDGVCILQDLLPDSGDSYPSGQCVYESRATLQLQSPAPSSMYDGSQVDSDNDDDDEEEEQKTKNTTSNPMNMQTTIRNAFSSATHTIANLAPLGKFSPSEGAHINYGGNSSSSPGFYKSLDIDLGADFLDGISDSLREELEAAKRQHLQEMEKKLERERTVAQQQMEREVARSQREAEAEMQRQQQEYERRLAELEKALWEQKQEQQETEQDKLLAQQRISKLVMEKQMLETEVLSNIRKLEEDARASQKTMAESRQQQSKLIDRLEQERQKIQKDVQRLEQLRLKRSTQPPRTRITPAKTPSSVTTSSTAPTQENLYRCTLLLREANKISQYFRKDVTYSHEVVNQGDETLSLIKVTNTKLDISTFWTMNKFEARLLHMRELFQSCDSDSHPGEVDEVFCDINDTWERSDLGVSPKVLENLKKRPGLRSRLSFDSASSLGSREGTPASNKSKGTPLRSVSSQEGNGPPTDSPAPQPALEVPSVVAFCREHISASLGLFTEMALQESVADKILLHCEQLKLSITEMLENFNRANEAGVQRSVFIDSAGMRLSTIGLTSHLEVILSQCSLWVGSYESLSSGLIQKLCSHILTTTKKLGTQLVLFLQGCENDLDSLVQESASQALSSLFTLSKHCGELALATETAMVSLTTTRGSTDSDEETELEPAGRVGHDVKQSFLSGCDVFIDKTLHGGLRSVEECETRLTVLSDDMSQNMPSYVEEVSQQVSFTVACTKAMLERCQQLQVDMDSTLQETLMEAKPEPYYSRSYARAQGLISHITNVTDTVSHLTQATCTYVKDAEPTSLRKVIRCAELIQKSSAKLLVASLADPANSSVNSSNSFQDATPDLSLLSESRVEQLEQAGREVNQATASLMRMLQNSDDQACSSSSSVSPPKAVRGKRMLPSSPVKGSGVTRRNSFSNKDSHRKVQALKMAFENTS